MKLFEAHEVAEAAGLNILGGGNTAKILMFLLGSNKLSKLYSEYSHIDGVEFIERLFDELEIKFEVDSEDLKKIPKSGPFITVSNHPFGIIDGLFLIYIIAKIRPDYKVMGNYLLNRIDTIANNVISVPSYNLHNKYKVYSESYKKAEEHLKAGGAVGFFPANEVSTYQADGKGVSDKQWEFYVLNYIKKQQVPVVPVYFLGNNSRLYHILGRISLALQTVKLPSEIYNQKNKTIKIRIGSPITEKEQAEFTEISRYGRFLRAKTYSLGSSLEVKKFFLKPAKQINEKVEEIMPPVPQEKILADIEHLRKDHLLFINKNYHVFCAPSLEMPNILNEIGRLREITFREVGEGTNLKQDIDEFDLYYNQLFIWDEEEQKIVGAYRVGKGRDILNQYGIKGFYIYTLFNIQQALQPVLNESLELGRSFITKEYQRKPLPLFLLWKGILYFLIKHPEYRYLVGPVSISSRFSDFSKRMIMDFIKANYYDHELAQFIKPRNKMTVGNYEDTKPLIETSSNINDLDRVIKDVEPGDFRMPVLLKKYIQLNGRIIGFNVDPLFNNALDGLLILDLFNVPIETITSLSKEINDDSILERFNPEINFANGIPRL